MSNAPRFDAETNDRDHAVSCDCEQCMPEGADGAVDDALGAAQAEMAKSGVRGVYNLRPLAKGSRIQFWGQGNNTRLDREALRAAERHLTALGMRATVLHLEIILAA